MNFRPILSSSAACLFPIPQIAVGFNLILLPFRSLGKAKPLRLEAGPPDQDFGYLVDKRVARVVIPDFE